MGKFIETKEKEFVNNYVNSYLHATDSYSRYYDGSPSFVTYYSVDKRASTTDPGLGTVVEVVGNESPIRYNKIENFPLFAVEEAIPALDYDEDSGLNTEMDSTALILPNTIIPSPYDLFTISYEEKENLYIVNNIEMSTFNDRIFYKITFNKHTEPISILDEKQIACEYDVVYANIGTEYKSVVEKKLYLLLDDIQGEYDRLSKYYIKYFYHKKFGFFIYNWEKILNVMYANEYENIVYDPKLAQFIYNNRLFIDKRNLLKNIMVEPVLKHRDYDYDYTIYYMLEHRNIEEFKYDCYYQILINKETPFSLFQEPFYENVHNPGEYLGKLVNFNFDYIFNCNLIDMLHNYNGKQDIEGINPIEEVFLYYLKEDKINYPELISKINNIKVQRNLHSYMLIPCILYILKEMSLKIYRNEVT